MSKLQLFRDFVNERLAAAALEIFGQYEKTLAERQEEICRSEDKSTLQTMLDVQSEIKLHRTDVQQLSLPEPPQIKEEQELWISQGGEQLQGLQTDTTDSIFTSPRVKTHCDLEDSSQLPPLDQTPTVETIERDSLPTNTTEVQIKAESDEEDYGAPEPASDSQPRSVTPDCPAAQSLEEEEERGGLLPELMACGLRPLTTRVLKSPIKSRRTQAKCSRPIPSPCASPETCLKTSPCHWTRPIPSSGTESDDDSSGGAESKTAKNPYEFEERDKAISQKGSLVVHRIIHIGENPYQCEECGRAFHKKSILVSHQRIHTGEKPYQCDECDKAFRKRSILVVHRRIHTGEKPYQCEECDKAFNEKGRLVRHRRIHTGEKPYQCQECDRAFSERGSLSKHKRIHTGEKPYQCERCDKVFVRKCNLDVHRRTHTGEKPYQCEECDKAFSQRTSLVNHGRIHTGEKPYQCQECGKAFRHKSSLMDHGRVHRRLTTYECQGKCQSF